MTSLFAGLTDSIDGLLFGEQGGIPGPVGGTSLTIKQLEGDDPQEIILSGRTMPYQNVEFGTEQATTKINYPGNPVATQQRLGPRDLDTEMQGAWKDLYIPDSVTVNGSKSKIKTAEGLVKLFHRVCRSSSLVRVQYAGEVRTGILKQFRPTYIRLSDITWSMTFEWQSRSDEQAARVAVQQDLGSAGFSLFGLLEDALALVGSLVDLANSFVASIFSKINAIRDQVAKAFELINLATTLLSIPGQIIGAIRTAVDSLVLLSTDLLEDLSRAINGNAALANDLLNTGGNPSERNSEVREKAGGLSRNTSADPDIKSTQYLAIAGNAANITEQLLVAAIAAKEQAIKAQTPDTQQVVTTKEGQTLYGVSLSVYGTPDGADYIAAANGISGSQVPGGLVLQIPVPPAGAGQEFPFTSATQGGRKLSQSLGCKCDE